MRRNGANSKDTCHFLAAFNYFYLISKKQEFFVVKVPLSVAYPEIQMPTYWFWCPNYVPKLCAQTKKKLMQKTSCI